LLLSTPAETGVFDRAGSPDDAGLESSEGVGEGRASEVEGRDIAGDALNKEFDPAAAGVGAGVGAARVGSGVGVLAGTLTTLEGVVALATVLSVNEGWPSESATAAGFGRSSVSGPSGPSLRDAALSRRADAEESLDAPARFCAFTSGARVGADEATYSARVCVGEDVNACEPCGGAVPTCAAVG